MPPLSLEPPELQGEMNALVRMARWPRNNGGIIVGSLIMALVVGGIGSLRYRHYWSGALDIGIFDHAMWLIAHGHLYESIIGNNILADHVSPILLVLGELYRLWASAYLLIAIQALALALTLFPMRRLGRALGSPTWFAPLATALNPGVLAAGLYDFHASTLAVLPVAWMLVGVVEDRKRLTTWSALALVLCRADMVLFLLAAGVLAKSRAVRQCLGCVALGAIVALLIPSLLRTHSNWLVDYANLGSSPIDALRHPWRLLSGAVLSNAVHTLIFILVPVAFLPLLIRRWFIACLIAVTPLMLVGAPGPHSPWFHYQAPFVPLTVGAAALAVARGPRLFSRTLSPVVPVIATVVVTLLSSPMAPYAPRNYSVWNALHQNPTGNFSQLIRAVPPGAVIAVDDQLVSHLTHRNTVYQYPEPFKSVGRGGVQPTAQLQMRVTLVIVSNAEVRGAAEFGFNHVTFRSGQYVVLTH